MKALDVYTRAKHDISNQLQLISCYLELEQYDKAKAAAGLWTKKIHEEQQLFQLPWPRFLEAVISYRTIEQNYSWRFEVNTTGDRFSDDYVTAQLKRWMAFISVIPAADKQLIELELTDDEDSIDIRFVLSGGDYSAVQGNDAFDWEITETTIAAAFKINK
ncbi:Spo0B domain-containing protein [Macrococcus equipercicus]|uniref:Spo0B domain-containing protein n=1 Tax=Macrococcus equipercicus TaxID=69967 RepID=A0A9Q9F0P3_9STAP|nr:Spo0B domain-containing protein [Macrococcus equipercicus]KAA1040005.1 hypothetical protein ERX35_003180 [Macrococcus equipercicus]UTH13062.1 Spo0B domain-containing protein [Macrococcus equipercicus]